MKDLQDKKLGRSIKDLTEIRLEPFINVVSLQEKLEFTKPKAKALVYPIASGKGGTGKTFFTTNLGVSLGELGLKTLIIDADFSLSNAHLLLGYTPTYDISHFIKEEKTLDEIILPVGKNLTLVPGTSGNSELSALSFRKLDVLVDAFLKIEPQYDIILVDLAAGISPQTINFLTANNELFIVINPDISSMIDAYALIKTVYHYNKDINVKFIINKVKTKEDGVFTYTKIGNIIKSFIPEVKTSLLGIISYNHYVLDSIYKRIPVVLSHPLCKTTAGFHQIARKIFLEQKKFKKVLDKSNLISYFYRLKENIL